MTNWSLEQDEEGRGVIKHHALPRFIAHWTSGTAKMSVLLEPCWSDAGSGEGEDCLHVFAFQWIDRKPDAMTFEHLMREAAKAIDEWITSRL